MLVIPIIHSQNTRPEIWMSVWMCIRFTTAPQNMIRWKQKTVISFLSFGRETASPCPMDCPDFNRQIYEENMRKTPFTLLFFSGKHQFPPATTTKRKNYPQQQNPSSTEHPDNHLLNRVHRDMAAKRITMLPSISAAAKRK